MNELGILVFGHTRPLLLADTLESLKIQGHIDKVDLWIDGDQGIADLRNKIALCHKIADDYQVRNKFYHRGQLGFRKMILLAMQHAVQNYKYIILLEDDCFPTKDAVDIFISELQAVEHDEQVFSVYGHPFLVAEESGYCSRFQGWGWATTSEKLAPYLSKLIDCYSMYERDYLAFTRDALTPEILERLDVTPPRLPSQTLTKFFAWDETLALLTALDKRTHKPTAKRIIYNCGIGEGASRFAIDPKFLAPPFNLVPHKEIWSYF